MNACIIACRTLEQELLAAMSNTGCTYPVRWLTAGAHNIPQKRRAEIQQALDECSGFDTVLLAMSLCGSSVTGLRTHDFQLLVPRCDDCISVLLGSQLRRREYPATYFLTGGWLKGQENIWNEYRRTVDKYGTDRAKRIFSSMLSHYEYLAFVDTGCGDASEQIQEIARELGLKYLRIPGTLSCLEDLLRGIGDSRFVTVPPHTTVTAQLCAGTHTVTVLPENEAVTACHGDNLLRLLQKNGLAPDAPCGGSGKCGKCRVVIDGAKVPACKTAVLRDMTVIIPHKENLRILDAGLDPETVLDPIQKGYLLAFDIGTTTVVGYLLDGKTGKELATAGIPNPQSVYGADVISRIQAALRGQMHELTAAIRTGLCRLTEEICENAGISPSGIGVVSMVGNPAMQQLFLGISPENLAAVPFSPVLTEAKAVPCGDFLPVCPHALLLTVPDISGYVGADTLGCVLSTGLHEAQELTLLVDIGTNGEMVLGNRQRMVACSTAAGPALEGANIRFGMSARVGAIDHVWLEEGKIRCSVIGGGKAAGICGSGLLDAVAAGLELGLLNKRGRIQNEDRLIHLTDEIYLTQEDIRQVQMAKGAIHAGIMLMAKHLGIEISEIRTVLLAGAFGSYLNPESACRMGLLPAELRDRIASVGNAAGAGAKMLARNRSCLNLCRYLVEKTEFLELASLPDFPRTFAKSMGFPEEK